jgi:predicted neuraminidase
MKLTALALAIALSTFEMVSQASELEDQPGYEQSRFIYEEAPFPSCHASTLAETPVSLVAAWFGGTDEGDDDVGIWFSRQLDGKWTAPVEVANGVQSAKERYPTWNPVLFQAAEGPLLLFYKVGPSPRDWWGMLITSSDHGATWSEPTRLPAGFYGPIKNKPVRLANGDLLCPTSFEIKIDGETIWQAYMERTPDLGKTWSKTDMLNDGHEIDAIQPSILFHSDTHLQALGRTREGKVWDAWSEDGGLSWGPLQLTELPNPNSGTDAVTLADGRHLLVYNHTAKRRSPLNVSVSKDGRTWQAALILEDQPGEYSYPGVIQSHDGRVHIIYTWNRQRIKHVEVDPAKLVPVEITGGKWPR